MGYYFTNPSASHYLRELAALLDVDPANLSRELRRLEQEGLFISEQRGRQKYFRLNRRYPLYEEVKGIIFKTAGVIGQLRTGLEKLAGIKEAYLYGSFARKQEDVASDIDLLIVGDGHGEQLATTIRKLEKRLGREINYTLLSPKEFQRRRARQDPFLEDIWRHKTIRLIPRA